MAGVGTGGTLTGVGRRYLKQQNPNDQGGGSGACHLPGAERRQGTVLTGCRASAPDLCPTTLDTSVYDEVIPVDRRGCLRRRAGKLPARKAILVGITSGEPLPGPPLQLARRPENKGKMIVALLPDTGERYLSTPMFAE